jgi:ubiquinone/menaquinone biosynthesis C-methylase UbiE
VALSKKSSFTAGQPMTQETGFFTDGEAYDRQMGRWSRAAGEVSLDWLSVPRGLRWLDAGCGTGAFTKLILERSGPSLLCAIDPSERQIDYARATPWAREVTIRVGTAQSVPFESAEFDVVVMALVITFVPDAAGALLELKRVARQEGSSPLICGISKEGATHNSLCWMRLRR